MLNTTESLHLPTEPVLSKASLQEPTSNNALQDKRVHISEPASDSVELSRNKVALNKNKTKKETPAAKKRINLFKELAKKAIGIGSGLFLGVVALAASALCVFPAGLEVIKQKARSIKEDIEEEKAFQKRLKDPPKAKAADDDDDDEVRVDTKTHKIMDFKYDMDDVCGQGKDLAELIRKLRNIPYLQEQGLMDTLPRGIILTGPPGTGKTFFARCASAELGTPYMEIEGSELSSGWGDQRLKDFMKSVQKLAETEYNKAEAAKRKLASDEDDELLEDGSSPGKKASKPDLPDRGYQGPPVIAYIDEGDDLLLKRGTGKKDTSLMTMLSKMNGDNVKRAPIIWMVSTNQSTGAMDPAILRNGGRFSTVIEFTPLHYKGRVQTLETQFDDQLEGKPMTLHKSVSLKSIAYRTEGFTGADVNELVRNSIAEAALDQSTEITLKHITKAIQQTSAAASRSRGSFEVE